MRALNLSEAARVTRRLLDQYGPARLLRVEELAPRALKECSLEELEALWAQAKSHPEAQA